MNILIYILTYILLTLSIIGLGGFFIKFCNLNIKHNLNYKNLGYQGLYGIFFLILITLVLNLVSPINIYFNTFLILFGLFLFFKNFFYDFEFINLNKNLFYSILISLFAIFYSKNHDDFPYYHLAFIDNLTLSKLEFGLGNLDIAFNHVSSMFFLSAVFKTLLTNDYFYFVSPLSIMVFSNSILLTYIFKKEQVNLEKFISLCAFIFINAFFSKIGDHGTDKSPQILIFILIIILFSIFRLKKENKFSLEFIIILLTLIISFKAFYFVYIIFFLIIFFRYYHIKKILFFINNYNICIYSFLIISLILFYNYAYSGCFIYPIPVTCKLEPFWSYGYENVKTAMLWYEQWSKAGAGPNFRIDNPENYVQGLNWLTNWIDVYFFNKVSDTLLGLLFVISAIYISLFPKKNSFQTKIINKKIYFIIVILFFIWFLKNPSLRYGGGYVVLSLLFFIPFSILLENQKYKFNFFQKRANILILVTIFIFILRNTNHMFFEIKKYNYNPIENPHYYLDESFKRLKTIKNNINIDSNYCIYNNNDFRLKKSINCKIISNYYFYYKKN